MSTTIWKFTLAIVDRQDIQLPKGAEVLDVQVQAGEPRIWLRCDPNAPLAPRTFILHGTGHPVDPDAGAHVATFQMHGGALVLHLFEARA